MRLHSALTKQEAWKQSVQAQGVNECGVTAPANALNIVYGGIRTFSKDDFLRQAGWFFQRKLGGTPSFITGWLLKRHGAGTHFGNVQRERGGDQILQDVLDRNLVVCIELGKNTIGPFTVFGEHSVVLTGYSTTDEGQTHAYIILDSEIKHPDGTLIININHAGMTVPGNRIFSHDEFWAAFPTGIYFPVFPNQTAHDRWYRERIRSLPNRSLIQKIKQMLITGSPDSWK